LNYVCCKPAAELRLCNLTADLNRRKQLVIEEQLGMLKQTQLRRQRKRKPGQFQAQVRQFLVIKINHAALLKSINRVRCHCTPQLFAVENASPENHLSKCIIYDPAATNIVLVDMNVNPKLLRSVGCPYYCWS
jgi:hypothetical protein